MKTFKIYTLVDITETKQYRKDPLRELQWQQQQNFSMLLQTIGMRANPLQIKSFPADMIDVKDFMFGTEIQGNHLVWELEFQIEYDNAFTDDHGDETALLKRDLHFVPVISGLEETVNLRLAVFDTSSTENRNTLVYVE